MKAIGYLLQKEFLQIFRNRGMLPIIFLMPFIQLVILSNAATFDVKNVAFHLQDLDRTSLSRAFREQFTGSGWFLLTGESFAEGEAINQLVAGKADLVLVIPRDFEKELMSGAESRVQLVINAEDGFSAGVIQAYSNEIVQAFNRTLPAVLPGMQSGPAVREIVVKSSAWYNPELRYSDYMVPGILVILVTMVGLFLSGMNIVREKEIGTIDQINVTPLKRYQFITGKLLPFWIIGLGELTLGLLIARIGFDVPMLGSYPLIYLVAALYMLVVLGMGLLISTLTDSQQQAMFIAWFFMVIFTLMSGLFTSIESMPHWAQNMTMANPVRHFVDIMRRVMLKGAGIRDIALPLSILTADAALMLALALNRYRKVSN
ncbi:MAG: ABC transporter permease [Pelodictyon luteolum]|uniref:ABC transporter permease n=1 Tax=Pelodictyon luteolum TaxID=1100 RepID=A0A165LWF7_PELLU|nr:ABC transporter permease [Pelodictyon luteolum]KZK74515.1 MAG: ABC transporter permease [Pelodictyon luteolum]